MISSMTGYGRAEAKLPGGKVTVEIRSLNAKGADISIKSQILPKDKEIEVRSRLAAELRRGTIDLFVTWEPNAAESGKPINTLLVKEYLSQLSPFVEELGVDESQILASILRFPDIIDTRKQEVITEETWPAVEEAITKAIGALKEFRAKEGKALYKDVTGRVQNILDFENEVESLETERIDAVRARLQKNLEDLAAKPDQQRFEQEMIYYLEKLDINEEKVRLRQHCKYFMDTIDGEPDPGKKLGFIIQEMGREINTTGSKANHAGIQKLVVRMKDELEKIREQSMNIL
ncbi:MAG: YicC family protein [Bacteroidales bacterium]|nr:YicC family protein [Bacteroidales bacterium]